LEAVINNNVLCLGVEDISLDWDLSIDGALIGDLGVAAVRDPDFDAECVRGVAIGLARLIDR
jgi:hypothetical protein